MLAYKTILGSIAVLIAIGSYIPYFLDILKGKTKPHAFSWLIWATLTAIAFFGQVFDNGGAGAWVTGFTAIISIVFFILALKYGEKRITRSDQWCLYGAAFAILLWWITDNALLAILLITVIDALGFYPTFRKSFHKPLQETMSTYVLSGLKFVIAIIALDNYSWVTALYPLSLVIMNWVFVVMIVIRRKQLSLSH